MGRSARGAGPVVVVARRVAGWCGRRADPLHRAGPVFVRPLIGAGLVGLARPHRRRWLAVPGRGRLAVLGRGRLVPGRGRLAVLGRGRLVPGRGRLAVLGRAGWRYWAGGGWNVPDGGGRKGPAHRRPPTWHLTTRHLTTRHLTTGNLTTGHLTTRNLTTRNLAAVHLGVLGLGVLGLGCWGWAYWPERSISPVRS